MSAETKNAPPPGAQEALRRLIQAEIETKRPGVEWEFMSDVMGGHPALNEYGPPKGVSETIFTVVKRDTLEDTRYVYQQFKVAAIGNCEQLVEEFVRIGSVEARAGVESWLRILDDEVATGPHPIAA